MFPVESLPSAYYEERANTDAAKRMAQQQQEALRRAQQVALQKSAQAVAHNASQAQPQHLMPNSHLQRPQLSRPASSGFLGNLFQGFSRSATPTCTPAGTPSIEKKEPVCIPLSDEMERLIAEKKRDADIVSLLPLSASFRATD